MQVKLYSNAFKKYTNAKKLKVGKKVEPIKWKPSAVKSLKDLVKTSEALKQYLILLSRLRDTSSFSEDHCNRNMGMKSALEACLRVLDQTPESLLNSISGSKDFLEMLMASYEYFKESCENIPNYSTVRSAAPLLLEDKRQKRIDRMTQRRKQDEEKLLRSRMPSQEQMQRRFYLLFKKKYLSPLLRLNDDFRFEVNDLITNVGSYGISSQIKSVSLGTMDTLSLFAKQGGAYLTNLHKFVIHLSEKGLLSKPEAKRIQNMRNPDVGQVLLVGGREMGLLSKTRSDELPRATKDTANRWFQNNAPDKIEEAMEKGMSVLRGEDKSGFDDFFLSWQLPSVSWEDFKIYLHAQWIPKNSIMAKEVLAYYQNPSDNRFRSLSEF